MNYIPNLDKKSAALLGISALAIGVSFIEQPANAAGTVPTDVQTAVDNTTATVGALAPIALAAITVALVPFGASMALSFVHKVMGKA
jgi:hypothetical protein